MIAAANNRRCFTLLEMVAVLVIAALVAAMAVAMLTHGGASSGGAVKHAEELKAFLEAARSRAVKSGGVQTVGLFREPLRWVWREADRELEIPAGLEVSRVSVLAQAAADGGDGAADVSEDLTELFVFLPGGAAASTRVRISGDGGVRLIEVSALTGAIAETSREPEPPKPLWVQEDEK